MSALLFLILELAEIHDAAYRWGCHRGNFHQIQLGVFRHLQSCCSRENSKLFTFRANQPHFGRIDFVIDALLLILSDGADLQKYKKSD